jgi:hypothetical protein
MPNLSYVGDKEGLMDCLKKEVAFWENYNNDDHRVVERYSEEDLESNDITQ